MVRLIAMRVLLEMDRARPLTLVPQRDSDSQKQVDESRTNALASAATMTTHTGSNLLQQFRTPYIPRMFNLALPIAQVPVGDEVSKMHFIPIYLLIQRWWQSETTH